MSKPAMPSSPAVTPIGQGTDFQLTLADTVALQVLSACVNNTTLLGGSSDPDTMDLDALVVFAYRVADRFVSYRQMRNVVPDTRVGNNEDDVDFNVLVIVPLP